MVQTLDPICQPDELFDFRGDDAPPLWMPHNQGDIFEGLPEIGGLASDFWMLFMHPCTMRTKGARLKPRITVIAVEEMSRRKVLVEEDFWSSQFAVMPLPDLDGRAAGTWIGNFLEIATVDAGELTRDRRIATLSDKGRLLFQQRIINHLTRYVPHTADLHRATTVVRTEAELQANWCEAACLVADEISEVLVVRAEAGFDAYMAANEGLLRLELQDESSVPGVVTSVNKFVRDAERAGDLDALVG